jgi:hypothetical protein
MQKHVRVTIDLKFQISEITEDDVKEDSKLFSNYEEVVNDPITWEIASCQNRLLQALLEDEEVFHTILTKYAVETYLEPSARGEVHSKFDVEAKDQQILEPVIAKLTKPLCTESAEV